MKQITLLFLLIVQSAIAQSTLFNQVEAKNIGPTIMSGRVVDLAVNPKNPTGFYARMLQADFGTPITTELLFRL